jgi:uncharacterized RDD family membrane protein YckC
LVRYLLSWLWFVPALAVASVFSLSVVAAVSMVFAWILLWALSSRFHPERQFWHDALAGTYLISVEAAAA